MFVFLHFLDQTVHSHDPGVILHFLRLEQASAFFYLSFKLASKDFLLLDVRVCDHERIGVDPEELVVVVRQQASRRGHGELLLRVLSLGLP